MCKMRRGVCRGVYGCVGVHWGCIGVCKMRRGACMGCVWVCRVCRGV